MFDSTYNKALSMLRAGHSSDEVAQCVADALNTAIRVYEDEKVQENNKQPSESETRAALHGFLAGLNDLYALFAGEGLNEDELEECVDEALKAVSDAANAMPTKPQPAARPRRPEVVMTPKMEKIGYTEDDFDVFLKSLRNIIN